MVKITSVCYANRTLVSTAGAKNVESLEFYHSGTE